MWATGSKAWKCQSQKGQSKTNTGLLSSCFPFFRQVVITGHFWCSWMKGKLGRCGRDWITREVFRKMPPKANIRKRSSEGGGKKSFPPFYSMFAPQNAASVQETCQQSPSVLTPSSGNLLCPVRAGTGWCYSHLHFTGPASWTSQHGKLVWHLTRKAPSLLGVSWAQQGEAQAGQNSAQWQ